MSDLDPEPTKSNHQTVTSTDRIKELNEIDKSISQLPRAAGEAIQILGSNCTAPNLSSAKSQFLESVTTYFTILSSIDVRLRRQVYALQEAGLIAEGDAKDAKRGASAPGPSSGGGGGQLEVSWLDSGGDRVERDMQREVWRRARELVERLVPETNGNGNRENNGDKVQREVNGAEVEVDMKDEKDEGW